MYARIESAGGLAGDYVRFHLNGNLVYTGVGSGIYFLQINDAGDAVEVFFLF